MNKGKIVVVDDEKIVTSAFSTLLKVEGFTDAHFFNNPKDAVEFLKENTPDLVISDFLMPEMNGLEFLGEVKKLYPEVSKILLTGYADKENAIKAINEIGLYRYIEKPWNNDDLIINIKNGIERSYLLSQLRQKISELEIAKKELEKYSHNLEELVAERTHDLQQSNAKLAGIVNYCADGIVILNEDGIIEQVNPACETLIGLVNNKIVSTSVDDFLFSKKTFISKELHNLEENELFLRDFYIKNPLSNNLVPVEISFARINPDEDFKRFVGVIRDVTEQKKADRLRDDFIATLTHDLRTPILAAIQTLKFFLEGALGELDDKQKLLLATMQKSNEDLLGLVNALLEVYKYDAEKLILNKTDFNIYELTKLVYDELKPLADNKNIDFSIECTDTAIEIQADRSELRRVICNLCGNAISYTADNGKVVITLKNEANDLIFSVSDNGCGIPQEDIPNMFQRFSQGTSKKRSAGTGLGLYLSRQIIESHGGKIWLESVINKGSEFSFILTDAVSKAGVLK
ncbi:MAG: ATP-binding protein [Candidatus Gastranaerophilales bacterium]|nr:ATP-binding protein [Candidatus Gastranaerophilales bacterium]MCM1072444.1 ATP-binding protein [Bacteroides sp.]